ncbi:uncharacterized protein J3D65DRAFT_421768 [Phyllosticta citribraziliensis]|uniref:Uncharacterized protein n=1 Tax=Phyllosticta citribraziliensis TaxID=989973 RepID=A0ABR1LJ29_9PEZI
MAWLGTLRGRLKPSVPPLQQNTTRKEYASTQHLAIRTVQYQQNSNNPHQRRQSRPNTIPFPSPPPSVPPLLTPLPPFDQPHTTYLTHLPHHTPQAHRPPTHAAATTPTKTGPAVKPSPIKMPCSKKPTPFLYFLFGGRGAVARVANGARRAVGCCAAEGVGVERREVMVWERAEGAAKSGCGVVKRVAS